MNSDFRFIEIVRNGPAEVLNTKTGDFSEELGSEEVLLDVSYSGINFADILMRLGLYRDAPAKPFVPGYELSGIVKKVGSQVKRFKEGDRVMAGTRFGGYVSKVKLSEWQVLKVPDGLSLAEAAALPVNYITSYIAFHEFGRVREGDRVLIDCATGGVGVAFLQMCQQTGAHAVGLTTSSHKKEFIASYGAKAYSRDEFAESSESDFDFILNSGGGKSLKDHYQRLAKSGKLCCIGLQSMVKNGRSNKFQMIKTALSSPWYPILKLVMESKAVCGFNALKYFDDEPWMRKHLPRIEKTTVKPFIGEVFDADDVAKAHRTLEEKKATGKVLLKW